MGVREREYACINLFWGLEMYQELVHLSHAIYELLEFFSGTLYFDMRRCASARVCVCVLAWLDLSNEGSTPLPHFVLVLDY